MDKIKHQLAIANEYYRTGNLRRASEICQAVLQENASHPDALHALAKIAMQIGQFSQADTLVRRALECNHDDPQLWLTLAGILIAKNLITDAEEALFIAISKGIDTSALLADTQGWLHLKKGQMDIAVKHFQQAVNTRNAGIATQLYRNSFLNPKLHSRGEPYIKELHNVIIETQFWMILDRGNVYSNEVAGRNIANSPRIRGRTTTDGWVILDTTPPACTVNESVVFVGGDDNYCHWLTRYLSRLALLEQHTELRSLPILVNHDMRNYQKDSLDLLGIPESSRIYAPENSMVSCNHIYIATTLRTNRHMDLCCSWLRKKLLPHIYKQKRHRRLYISRSDVTLRRLLNEEELVHALEKRGFECINPGTLSFTDQIEIFSQASVVVGPHGAGLTNILFAPASCRVLELSDCLIAHMPDFRWIANARGQTIVTTVSNDVEMILGGTLPQRDHNFRVNIPETLLTVDRLLAHH